MDARDTAEMMRARRIQAAIKMQVRRATYERVTHAVGRSAVARTPLLRTAEQDIRHTAILIACSGRYYEPLTTAGGHLHWV